MSRIAVKMDTDTIPVSGVDDLEKHLDQLASDPNLPLDNKLFDHVELQVTGMPSLPSHLSMIMLLDRQTSLADLIPLSLSVSRRQHPAPHPTSPSQDHRHLETIPT